MTMKVGARDQLGGLMTGAAEHQVASGSMECLGQFFERTQAGGVDSRHVAKPEDDDLGQVLHVIEDGTQLVGGAKQEWSVDPEDLDKGRNRLVLEDVDVAFLDVLVRDGRYCGRVGV